jgi:hypothetical protein
MEPGPPKYEEVVEIYDDLTGGYFTRSEQDAPSAPLLHNSANDLHDLASALRDVKGAVKIIKLHTTQSFGNPNAWRIP